MDELDFDAATAENAQRPTPNAERPTENGAVEYEAPNGDVWRVERGLDLIHDFELESPDGERLDVERRLQAFHAALCNQEAAWNVICRIYGNSPLLGATDPDELMAWTLAELAEKRGVEPREIEALIEGAKTFWKRAQLATQSTENIRVRPALDDDTADQLLREHGFALVENGEERKYIATRCMELQPWLDDDRLRAAARSLIQQEVTLFYILDPGIRELRALLAYKATRKDSVEKENSQLLSLMKERRDAQQSLDSSMKVLGLSDAAGGTLKKKMAFQDCLSMLMAAMQRYYSENDRELIDGLFGAAEVELLTTPTELRPMQYRADLVLMALEAKEHLWEKDWSPTPIGRRACRKLAAGFNQGLNEARSQEGEVLRDEAVEEISDEAAGTPAAAGPFETSTGNTAPPLVPASRAPASGPAAMFT